MKNLPDGDQNVVIGSEAMLAQDSSASGLKDVVAIGYRAFYGTGAGTSDPDGTVAIGSLALNALTEGIGNVAVGFEALRANTDGDNSTAIGFQALTAQAGQSGTVGNTAVGHGAAETITLSLIHI